MESEDGLYPKDISTEALTALERVESYRKLGRTLFGRPGSQTVYRLRAKKVRRKTKASWPFATRLRKLKLNLKRTRKKKKTRCCSLVVYTSSVPNVTNLDASITSCAGVQVVKVIQGPRDTSYRSRITCSASLVAIRFKT